MALKTICSIKGATLIKGRFFSFHVAHLAYTPNIRRSTGPAPLPGFLPALAVKPASVRALPARVGRRPAQETARNAAGAWWVA